MTNAVRWTCTLTSFTLLFHVSLSVSLSLSLSLSLSRAHILTHANAHTSKLSATRARVSTCWSVSGTLRVHGGCLVIFELENYPDVICGCMRARISTRSLHWPLLLHCRWSLFFLWSVDSLLSAMFAYRLAHHRINALCYTRCYCSAKWIPLILICISFGRESSQTWICRK